MTGGGIVIVAPVFNEAGGIVEFLRSVEELSRAMEIACLMVVDDGSTDNTVSLIHTFSATSNLPIRLLQLSRNFGHQNAITAGMKATLESTGAVEWIGLIDADLQDNPMDFVLLQNENHLNDVVYAVHASRKESIVFRLGAGMFHWLISRFSRFRIPKNAGTFSLMRRFVVEKIVEHSRPDSYFPGLRAWVGFRQKGVLISRNKRIHGESRIGWMGLARLAASAILTYSSLPLQLLTLMALFVFVGSVFFGVLFLVLRLMGLVEVQGIAAVLAAVFFSLGLQSVYLSLIAFMITRAENAHAAAAFVVASDQQLDGAQSANTQGDDT